MSELRIAILKRRETEEIDTPTKIGDDVISKTFLLFLKSIETFVKSDFSYKVKIHRLIKGLYVRVKFSSKYFNYFLSFSNNFLSLSIAQKRRKAFLS